MRTNSPTKEELPIPSPKTKGSTTKLKKKSRENSLSTASRSTRDKGKKQKIPTTSARRTTTVDEDDEQLPPIPPPKVLRKGKGTKKQTKPEDEFLPVPPPKIRKKGKGKQLAPKKTKKPPSMIEAINYVATEGKKNQQIAAILVDEVDSTDYRMSTTRYPLQLAVFKHIKDLGEVRHLW